MIKQGIIKHLTICLLAIAVIIVFWKGEGKTEEKKGRTWIIGELKILEDSHSIIGEQFRCDSLNEFKKGEQFAAYFSQESAWSSGKGTVSVSNKKMSLPFIGIQKGSDGKHRTLTLSSVQFSIDIPKNEVIKDGSYSILTHRDIKKGEVIAAYAVATGEAIFTLEAVEVRRDGNPLELPAVLISKGTTLPLNEDATPWLDLWRRVRNTMMEGTP